MSGKVGITHCRLRCASRKVWPGQPRLRIANRGIRPAPSLAPAVTIHLARRPRPYACGSFRTPLSGCYHKMAQIGEIPAVSFIASKEVLVADTKKIEDKLERKKVKRAARKKAAPKAKRTTPRGSAKKKVKKMVRGQSKR